MTLEQTIEIRRDYELRSDDGPASTLILRIHDGRDEGGDWSVRVSISVDGAELRAIPRIFGVDALQALVNALVAKATLEAHRAWADGRLTWNGSKDLGLG